MKKLNWSIISLCFLLITFSCKSQTQSGDSVSDKKAELESNPLQERITQFFAIFESTVSKDFACEDLVSKAGIGKEMVVEYIDTEVRDWPEEDWKEMSYNAIFAIKKKHYYVFAIEVEGPGYSKIYLNTYDLNGIRKSSISICEDSPGGEIKSRVAEDLSIFRMDDYGVSTYKLNSRGVYVKGG